MSEFSLPTPSEEHTRITSSAGTWDVDCSFFQGGPEPMKVAATEIIEALGPFFSRSAFQGEMYGMSYQGSATLGYEPHTKDYVATWIDSMTPQQFVFRGRFDAAGQVLTMSGEMDDLWSGGRATYRTVETHEGPDRRTFEMFMQAGDAPEIQLCRHVYTRRT